MGKEGVTDWTRVTQLATQVRETIRLVRVATLAKQVSYHAAVDLRTFLKLRIVAQHCA